MLIRIAVILIFASNLLTHEVAAEPFGSLAGRDVGTSGIRHTVQSGKQEIEDGPTGIRLSVPFDIVTKSKRTKWGTNWKSSDNRLNIDTLNFTNQRTLKSVHQSLRSISGRRITHDRYDGTGFTLQGRDSDGSILHVEAIERGGEVRGISIVYSDWARGELAPVADRILRSFTPFPERRREPTISQPPAIDPAPPVATARPIAPSGSSMTPQMLHSIALEINHYARMCYSSSAQETRLLRLLNAGYDPEDTSASSPSSRGLVISLESALSRFDSLSIVDPRAFGKALESIWDVWRKEANLVSMSWTQISIDIVLLVQSSPSSGLRLIVHNPRNGCTKYVGPITVAGDATAPH